MTTVNITIAELETIINEPKNLYNYLKELLSNIDGKCIMIRGLDSNQRHLIYKQMIYPLRFEKIKECETSNDVTIKVYKKNNKNEEVITKIESSESELDPDYNPTRESAAEDSEDSEDSEDEELEYNNEKINREYLQLILDIQSKTVNKLETIELNTNKIIRRTNLLMAIAVIGWTLLIILDPVKLVVTN